MRRCGFHGLVSASVRRLPRRPPRRCVMSSPVSGTVSTAARGGVGAQGGSQHQDRVAGRAGGRRRGLGLPDHPDRRLARAARKHGPNSFGEQLFQVFRHGDAMSAVFRETYSGTVGTDASHTGCAHRQRCLSHLHFRGWAAITLADLFTPGVDHGAEIPLLARPSSSGAGSGTAATSTGQLPVPSPQRWTPDKVYSGGYKAWALTPDELILYMPDYPVARDTPTDFTPGVGHAVVDGRRHRAGAYPAVGAEPDPAARIRRVA